MPLVDYATYRRTNAVGDASDCAGLVSGIVTLRRAALDAQDVALGAQATATSPEDRNALEQTVQTLGALLREHDALLRQARGVQVIYDQLMRTERDVLAGEAVVTLGLGDIARRG